ncbi:hypothetical protein OHX08_17825 [Acinetobacter baumannii]|nr:hypothetical protein [Acinetobacter baumannii]
MLKVKNESLILLFKNYLNFKMLSIRSKSDYDIFKQKYKNSDNIYEIEEIFFGMENELRSTVYFNEIVSLLIEYNLFRSDYFIFFEENVNFKGLESFNEILLDLIKANSLKELNSIELSFNELIFTFVPLNIVVNKKTTLPQKKANLFKAICLEMIIQTNYYIHFSNEINCENEFIKNLNDISVAGFLIEKFMKDNNFLINTIETIYSKQTKKAIENRTVRGEKEALEYFKKYLSDRKVIESKEKLEELIRLSLRSTKDDFDKKIGISIETRYIKNKIYKWINEDFESFSQKKGIKFHNSIYFLIYSKNK